MPCLFGEPYTKGGAKIHQTLVGLAIGGHMTKNWIIDTTVRIV